MGKIPFTLTGTKFPLLLNERVRAVMRKYKDKLHPFLIGHYRRSQTCQRSKSRGRSPLLSANASRPRPNGGFIAQISIAERHIRSQGE